VSPARGAVHHIELWVANLRSAEPRWRWLLAELGYQQYQAWSCGVSFALGPTYLVLEQSPGLAAATHDRLRPGMNHLAFHAGARADVDALVRDADEHGWTLMFADRHPFAGGPDTYAAYLEDVDGFEVELVADSLR
jgi:catechol-2,3-dioxygenase